MIRELFEKQRKYINFFFDTIDFVQVEKLLEALLNTSGTVIVSGVGKSGIVANKFAMTLLSTGTQAIFLPPIDALHGDIGIVTEKDLCLFLSKSGETKELIQLIPYIRKKGARIISIVSHENSRLKEFSDQTVILPLEKELCPFNLSPTTSSSIQMIFGDIIAVALMKAKKFSLDEYAQNHPAGNIGKKITLIVEDLMFKEKHLPLCSAEDRTMDVLSTLTEKGCGCLIVVHPKENFLEGIFTDGDLRRAIQKYGPSFLEKKIKDLMTKNPKSTTPETLVWNAMKLMEEDSKKLISVLPVVRENRVVGILRMHDIVQAGFSE